MMFGLELVVSELVSSPTLLAWVGRYGYAAVALGVLLESAFLPMPGETMAFLGAFAAAHGGLSLGWVIAAVVGGAIVGDNLGYFLGHRFGRDWLERHGRWVLLSPARLTRMDGFFARFGPAAVTIARFVTGVRVVAAFAAGASRMRWGTFLVYNFVGAVLWGAAVCTAGYALGRGYAGLATGLGHVGVVVVLTLLVALLTVWVWRRARRGWPAAVGDLSAHVSAWSTASRQTAREWLRQLGRHAAGALAISAGTTLAFASLAEEVAEQETTTFDATVRAWALGLQGPVLDRVFTTLTLLGSVPVLLLLSVVVAGMLWRRRGRRVTAALVMAPLLASGAVVGFKYLFHRTRPAGALQHPGLGYAFPSGHATFATAVLLTLAYVLVRERIAPAWTLAVGAIVALLVGLSRIYLDVHWATDVVGGWSIGTGIAMASVLLYERAREAERDATEPVDRGSLIALDRAPAQ
jgi:membrane protein DedA with SNARE-associated domain/membrane-associated phospholipid phosphatase